MTAEATETRAEPKPVPLTFPPDHLPTMTLTVAGKRYGGQRFFADRVFPRVRKIEWDHVAALGSVPVQARVEYEVWNQSRTCWEQRSALVCQRSIPDWALEGRNCPPLED